MKYLVWIWRNSAGVRLNMLSRIAVGTGRVGSGLLMVWLCKRFIDTTIHTGTVTDVILMIVALLGTITAGVFSRQLYYYWGVRATAVQSTAIRLRIFSHLFQRQIYDSKDMHSGDITSRLEKDIEVVSDATSTQLTDMAITAIQLTGAFLMMMSMDTKLAWMLLLLTPLFIVVGKLIAHRMRQMTLDIRQQESVIQMLLQETIEHNAVLRSLESGGWVTGRLDDMQHDLRGKINRRARFTLFSRLFMGLNFSLGYIIAFIWGGLQLRSGLITFGVMTSFLQLVSQIQQPILQMLNLVPQAFQASASIDRLVELEQAETEEAAKENKLLHGKTGLIVDNLSFHYATGDRQIFSHFSHQFPPGSKTALMGHTGVGKTTLFRLLLALVKPTEGTLTIYNSTEEVPIDNTTRCNFVFVPQGNTLMSGTIRYNLLLAKPKASDEELKKVLHTAMADFVLDLPEGLNSECGERGGGLSEGQAQRIAIARGLLRPGNIMLLDEISASLDEQTEQELYRRLFDAYPHKTMIFITHRPIVSRLCNATISLD